MLQGVRYGRWNPEDMEKAPEKVRNGNVGLRRASREFFSKSYLEKTLKWKNYYVTREHSVSEGNLLN
jgi:hypothetical protein